MAVKNPMNELKILIIDDQPDARAMLRAMLSEIGVTQVFEAADGKQAFTFIDSAFDLFNLIICDWNMPGMTGLELLRQVRTVDQKVPFLMVTGRSDVASVAEAKSAGVTAYIRKPYSPAQLEAKIRAIMHKMAA